MVGVRARVQPSAAERCSSAATGGHEPRDVRWADAQACRRPGLCPHSADGDGQGVHLRLGLNLCGDCPQNGTAVPPGKRQAGQVKVPDGQGGLPRRHVRGHERMRPGYRYALSVLERAAAAHLLQDAWGGWCVGGSAGEDGGKRWGGGGPGTGARGTGSGGHAILRPCVPYRRARAVLGARCRAHLRRDRDRLRKDGGDVGEGPRQGRGWGGRQAGHHVRGQGAHWRLHDLGRHARHGKSSHGLVSAAERWPASAFDARADLHRQPSGLRRRPGKPEPLDETYRGRKSGQRTVVEGAGGRNRLPALPRTSPSQRPPRRPRREGDGGNRSHRDG
mmetsp:Transcript_22012/g.45951  ORF Transcript_22012/g.45951 Transcript_22012/m.45951 type:complete len:333 (-) Transcript_22012:208-1206(-)